MRIVHVITRLIIGGAQENTILSCEGLHARGHEVHLISGPTTGPEGSLVSRAAAGGYRFEEVQTLVRNVNPLSDLRAMRALSRRFRELRPDVVHTHSSKAGVLGRMAAARAAVPHIVHTIHGMSFNRTQHPMTRALYAFLERRGAARCHAIVGVADAMVTQALAAGIGRRELFVTIRSGMELEPFDPSRHDVAARRAAWGLGENHIVVGTVARLFVNKGYEQLIDVMDRSLKQEPKLRFVWVGDGADRKRYMAELARRGLADRVTITGLVPPTEIPEILSAIDILAHTSQWEGLPRAVVQAMLLEKPAVSFSIDGAPEVVLPGRTGELAALGDLEGFSSALVALARDPKRRAEYGRHGRALCLSEFGHDKMCSQLEALYERLAQGKSPGEA